MSHAIISDYQKLAQQKDRRADHFAEYDFLFAAAAQDLSDRLSCIQRNFSAILELNAHGNLLFDHLNKESITQIGQATYEATYYAPKFKPMASHLSKSYLVDTPEDLPTTKPQYDLVIANLNLHWINNLPQFLSKISELLYPDGLFMANLIGGNSFQELRHLLMECDLAHLTGAAQRMIPMVDIKDLGHLIQRAGFTLPVIDKDIYPLSYQSLQDLRRDFKGMGEGNALAQPSLLPLSRSYQAQASALFKDLFAPDPASPNDRNIVPIDILTATAWKYAPEQSKPAAPGSASLSLQNMLHSE